MARPCKIGSVKVCMDFENLVGCLPDSSRLVCQGLVEEGEGLLPSPPATSKMEVAHRKREVGTSGWGEGLGLMHSPLGSRRRRRKE